MMGVVPRVSPLRNIEQDWKCEMHTNIVGVSSYTHDAACCLLQDGFLVAAAEEERFTRQKHDLSMPCNAFRWCLNQSHLSVGDIDGIGYFEQPCLKLGRQLWTEYPALPHERETAHRLDPNRAEFEIRDLFGYEGPIVFAEHHRSHAASCFYYSGFQEAAILVVDGVGEWATTTYCYGHDGTIDLLEEVRFPDSLGLLYSTVTSYLGFEVNEGEYKVMGLAAYGQPKYAERIRRLIKSGQGGQFQLDMRYFDFMRHQRMFSEDLCMLLGGPPRSPESAISSLHQDIAKSLQVVVEQILLEKAEHLYSLTGSNNLCMAGGVALNCVANSRIRAESRFKSLFVQPAAGDAGGALGAASLAYATVTGMAPPQKGLSDVFFGPGFEDDEILPLLSAFSIVFADHRGRERTLLDETVSRLAAGGVVGWFQGRMELGPRSLGGRSILADPRSSEIRDRVNTIVKMREEFRPFAPAVLEEKAAEHFDLDHASPFMLEVATVHSKIGLPGTTHVDGSARVQTVSRDAPHRFRRLLEAFEERTGCPILLNTSFNVRGEPIVCTPTDALRCFMNSQLDSLVLGNFIIDRKDIPCDQCKPWDGFSVGARPQRRVMEANVYSLW
jgi:carbamoyltransferase